MAKNKSKAIQVENEQVENVRANAYIETELDNIEQEDNEVKEEITIKKHEKIVTKKEKKRTGTVILVSELSVVVEDENGNGYTLFNHPEAKYGDIIEF